LFVGVEQGAHFDEVFMVFADSILGEVMREELGVFHDEGVCASDEAQSFYAHAVEPFAVEGPQVGGVWFELAFDLAEQMGY
jgi:hypothetical protein